MARKKTRDIAGEIWEKCNATPAVDGKVRLDIRDVVKLIKIKLKRLYPETTFSLRTVRNRVQMTVECSDDGLIDILWDDRVKGSPKVKDITKETKEFLNWLSWLLPNGTMQIVEGSRPSPQAILVESRVFRIEFMRKQKQHQERNPRYVEHKREQQALRSERGRLNTTSIAASLRERLQACFPSAKFSVRKTKDCGGGVDVAWKDGPMESTVMYAIEDLAKTAKGTEIVRLSRHFTKERKLVLARAALDRHVGSNVPLPLDEMGGFVWRSYSLTDGRVMKLYDMVRLADEEESKRAWPVAASQSPVTRVEVAKNKRRAICPHCKKGYKLPTDAIGKTATCKKCHKKFVVKPSR